MFVPLVLPMSKKEESTWTQEFVLRVRSGCEIPLDIDSLPDPTRWKFLGTNPKKLKGKKNPSDWYEYVVHGTRVRYFSNQIKSFYDKTRSPYITQTLKAIDDEVSTHKTKKSKNTK